MRQKCTPAGSERLGAAITVFIKSFITIPMAHPIGVDDGLVRPNCLNFYIFRETGELFALRIKPGKKIGALIPDYGQIPPTDAGADIFFRDDHIPLPVAFLRIMIAGPAGV